MADGASVIESELYEVVAVPMYSNDGRPEREVKREMTEPSVVEYDEPQFQQRRKSQPDSVGEVPCTAASTNPSRPSLSVVNALVSAQRKELIRNCTVGSRENRDNKRNGQMLSCRILSLVAVLGLVFVAVTALLLGGLALGTQLCTRGLGCSSGESSRHSQTLQTMQLSSLQRQVENLRAMASSVEVAVNVTAVQRERCRTLTRVCSISVSPLVMSSCTTEGVRINHQDVYTFGVYCSVRASDQMLEPDDFTTSALAERDAIGKKLVVEPVTSANETFCKCRVRRREQQLINPLLPAGGVHCELRITLCHHSLNSTVLFHHDQHNT